MTVPSDLSAMASFPSGDAEMATTPDFAAGGSFLMTG
jgi:hypothetical protein